MEINPLAPYLYYTYYYTYYLYISLKILLNGNLLKWGLTHYSLPLTVL